MVKNLPASARGAGLIPGSGRRTWQPTSVFLPGESHGQRNPVGYSPQGCKELDMTEATEQAYTNTAKVPSADFSPKGAVESNNNV